MEFWQGLEDPRNDRIYSSGNRGMKKGPGPRGTRDEEFLVPSLNAPQAHMSQVTAKMGLHAHRTFASRSHTLQIML